MAISSQAQRILDAYAATVGGKQDPRYTNVIDVIQNTPSLEAAFNKAAQDGTLLALRLDQAGMARNGMGGAYYPNSYVIAIRDTTNPQRLVFTLAHEVQHANHSVQKKAEYVQIYQSMERVAADTRSSVHDYTPAIRKGLQQNREDEARAQIAGWNAYVEYQKNIRPGITDQEILVDNPHKESISSDGRTVDRVTMQRTQVLHSDLQFNPDLTLPVTGANIEAMGRHFYDKSQGLGRNFNLNYQNYYADYYVEAAASLENKYRPTYRASHGGRSVQVRIDMRSMGLDEQRMEAQGLSIPGGNLNYADASNPAQVVHSTLNGSSAPNVRYNPMLEAVTRQTAEQEPVVHAAAAARDRFQGDAGLSGLARNIAATWPHLDGEQNARLTAYCANRCTREGMAIEDVGKMVHERRADGRVLLHAMSRDGQQVVTVNVERALNTPVEQSLANLQQAQQPPQQEQAQQQTQAAVMRM